MMKNKTNLDQLRRLRVLQALQQSHPDPMGEIAVLNIVQVDVELSPTIERVRQSIRYLYDYGLAQLIGAPDTDWIAGRITDAGLAFLSSSDGSEYEHDIYHPSIKPEPASQFQTGGRVSSVTRLPTEVKAWLDQELVRLQFSGYVDLADRLKTQGYEISKSALGRYGKKFKDEQKELKQSIEMAKAFAEVIGDDGAALNQTLTALAQKELMEVIRTRRYDENIKLPHLIRSIASLNRSDINTKKFNIEQAAEKRALNKAADAVEKAATQKGMSKQDAQFWREQVLGVK